jgi:hypothetical protein
VRRAALHPADIEHSRAAAVCNKQIALIIGQSITSERVPGQCDLSNDPRPPSSVINYSDLA